MLLQEIKYQFHACFNKQLFILKYFKQIESVSHPCLFNIPYWLHSTVLLQKKKKKKTVKLGWLRCYFNFNNSPSNVTLTRTTLTCYLLTCVHSFGFACDVVASLERRLIVLVLTYGTRSRVEAKQQY